MVPQKLAVALFLFSLIPVGHGWPQGTPRQADSSSGAVKLYTSPEENAEIIGTLAPGESTTPIAETQTSGGLRWYLVKAKSGLVGWIKQNDGEHSKKADDFFKPLPIDPAVQVVPIPSVSSSAAPRGAIMVPVLPLGQSMMIVAATVNQRINANLLIDTGATSTVISRRLAGLLTLLPLGKAFVHTVGGPVAVSLGRLESLKVGTAEVNKLQVLIHDFSPDPRIEGLLGMDFLGRFEVGFDSRKQLLILSPR